MVLTEEERAQKQQARREQGLRLKEMAEKRRKEQREQNEKALAELLVFQSRFQRQRASNIITIVMFYS